MKNPKKLLITLESTIFTENQSFLKTNLLYPALTSNILKF